MDRPENSIAVHRASPRNGIRLFSYWRIVRFFEFRKNGVLHFAGQDPDIEGFIAKMAERGSNQRMAALTSTYHGYPLYFLFHCISFLPGQQLLVEDHIARKTIFLALAVDAFCILS